MTGDKSLNLLEEARKHRKKAAEMRRQAAGQPDLKEMYEDLARGHETAADEIESRLSPGLTKKT